MFVEVLLGLTLLIILYLLNKKPSNIPPGIWGWPIVGSIPSSKISMVEQIINHSKKYGDIFTWRIGGRISIFLCKADVIKTAMKMPELSDRPELFSFDSITDFEKIGIVNANGFRWVANRRFALRHLKNMGLGKSTYENVIQDEIICMVKDIKKHSNGGRPQKIPWSLNVAILNVIWRITADRRYDVDDEEIHYFHELMDKTFGDVPTILALYDLIPWLHKIVPGFIEKWLRVQEYLQDDQAIMDFLRKIVKEHTDSLDPENPRDYIDHYLIEMEEQKNNPQSTMNEKDLLAATSDLFIAGSETTSSTIRWAIFYLAKYPEIQRKAQEEIDTIVGKGTLPALVHREKLPYFDAVCHELQRFITLVPLSVPHSAHKEVKLNGYTIPKGSVIIAFLVSCHFDPDLWKNPKEFDPQNFLDDEGNLLKKKDGALIPFGTGKRSCIGESLATMEIYLFLSALLQNFSFRFPEGENTERTWCPNDRIINACRPFNVIIESRF